jgi:hypothetical protein
MGGEFTGIDPVAQTPGPGYTWFVLSIRSRA